MARKKRTSASAGRMQRESIRLLITQTAVRLPADETSLRAVLLTQIQRARERR